ncbi:MAG TPA: outer membrane beta-barrel family protein [Flavisolibacter sp.]
MKPILLLALLALTSALHAQKFPGIVKGVLADNEGAPLGEATVSIMGAKDSTLVSFTLTSNSGFFEIKNVDAGSYYALFSYQGYAPLKKPFSITSAQPVVDLAAVKLERSYKTLGEVIVADEAPIKIKGDTIAYNAGSFKTKPNATVEDLLKKLPGMTVERDGTVKAQGENVQKVYVDGKEFFGNDPKLATKNLSADMIDQVEVYDDMSEQAKFNKIDDGSRSKAINLKLKKDKKKGVFGKANAGYGTQDRYDAGLTANFFKGATQVSVIAKANNTNNIGFSISDAMGMFGGGFGGLSGAMGNGMTMRGGGSGPTMMAGAGASQGGITRTGSAGINYRDVWSKNVDVTASYFYNNAVVANNRSSNRQTFFRDSTLIAAQDGISENRNSNHRANLNLKWEIDSLNSIIYQPNVSFQNSSTFYDDSTVQFAQKGTSSHLLNAIRNVRENEGTGVNWVNNLIWRRRLNKIGRTLSVSLTNTYSENDREGYLVNNSDYYSASGIKFREGRTAQQNLQTNGTSNYGATVSYTEPIARNKVLELNYGYTRNSNESDRRTFNLNRISGKYDLRDELLTNHFQTLNEQNRVGTNFRVTNKKYNYQLGLSVQNTLLRNENLTKGAVIEQKYTNLFPTVSFNYNFARSRNLRINYRGRTSQPSVTQLQELDDSTGFPIIRTGNSSLGQEFSNNLTLSYNFFDLVRFQNVFALVSFNNTNNKIVDAITNRGGGIQYVRPVNVDGVYNVTGAFNVGFPIKKMKGGNFNTNTRISYARNANVIDNLKTYNKNLSLGEDLRLSYNYKDKLDVGASASTNYTSVKYPGLNKPVTFSGGGDQSYFTHIFSADVTYTFPKGFILSSDVDYTINPEQGEDVDRTFAMLNASLAKQVFKNKRGEFKLSAFDLLNQNQSFTRNTSDNYIEDVRNTVLQRFFLLSFTYNLNRMGGKSMMPRMLERATKNIRLN